MTDCRAMLAMTGGENMKKEKKVRERPKERVSRSTNYAPDPHGVFCKRCYAFNKGCPNTRSKIKDVDCYL